MNNDESPRRPGALRGKISGPFLDETQSSADEVGEIVALAQDMKQRFSDRLPSHFDAESWALEWLQTPNPALGGRPIDVIPEPGGLDQVKRLMRQLESGAYA